LAQEKEYNDYYKRLLIIN